MHIIKNKFWFRFFLFTTLVLGSYNFFGQSLSFGYVQGYFGVTSKDAAWLLRGFQSGTIITGIGGLIFIKWIGLKSCKTVAIVFCQPTPSKPNISLIVLDNTSTIEFR